MIWNTKNFCYDFSHKNKWRNAVQCTINWDKKEEHLTKNNPKCLLIFKRKSKEKRNSCTVLICPKILKRMKEITEEMKTFF